MHISSVENLLAGSPDPIAEMYASLEADMSSFGLQLMGSDLHDVIGPKISDLRNFDQLLKTATDMGFLVSNVMFRGFKASKQLQRQYDQEAELHASLETEKVKADQQQSMVDRELDNQKRRADQEHQIQSTQLTHQLEMQQRQHEADLNRQSQKNNEMLELLTGLKRLDVDLTKFLCSDRGQKIMRGNAESESEDSNFSEKPSTASKPKRITKGLSPIF